MPHRHFPAPWSLEEQADCVIVRDHNGQALTYVYFKDEPLRRSGGKSLSRDEAWRIAAIMANLPNGRAPAQKAFVSPVPQLCAFKSHAR